MSARVLIVEDEAPIARGLQDLLAVKGYQTLLAVTGPEALVKAREAAPDLILLDVMLPGLSGFDVLRTLRAEGRKMPVVMLTAKGTEIDKVLGFELGVDDYVTKPFSALELLGRVQAVLRRSTPEALPSVGRMSIGRAEVDFDGLVLRVDGAEVALPARAIEVLHVLARSEGTVVSRDRLLDEVWGADQEVNPRTVDNMVVKLRQAIEPSPDAPAHLHTVHGRGYRLSKG